MTISVPVDLYEYCSGRSRSRVFGTYVCDPIQRPFLDSLLKSIDDTVGGTEPGSDEEFDAVVRFVQSLKYSRDTDDTGHLEYPKYPVETLVHRQGDCEDGTILMGALLRRLGYDVVVVSLPDHAHMVLGVALDDAPGDSITHEGAEYSVVETTSTGWEVGQVPPRLSGARVECHPVTDLPVLIHEWTARPESESRLDVELHVANFGEAAAERVEGRLRFADRNDRVYRETALLEPTRIDAGESTRATDRITLPHPRELRGECTLSVARQLHDRSESEYA